MLTLWPGRRRPGAGGLFAASCRDVFAAPGAADTRFLLVFLRGGYDAANVVIPVGSPFYYEAAAGRSRSRDPIPAIRSPLSRSRSLGRLPSGASHPALKDSIYPLWQRGQVAFVPFAGSRDMTRSHFETQDSVEEGLPLPVESPRTAGPTGRAS